MNLDVLEKLFGSSARVKILRLFLFNKDKIYSLKEVSRRTKTGRRTARKEIFLLLNLGFVKEKPTFEERDSGRKRKVKGYGVDLAFRYYTPLYDLLIDTMVMASLLDENRLWYTLNSIAFDKYLEDHIEINKL
jgi:hypothetical protein